MKPRHLSSDEERPLPLAHVALGDIVTLPDGRQMTVRAAARLAVPIGSLAGFVVCGELDVVLTTPATPDSPVNLYLPVDQIPGLAQRAQTAAEGATRYWAPHLPALRGAMGELLYRILEVRGSIHPVILVYRGQEVIRFVRASDLDPQQMRVMYMDRSSANDVDVVRHSATVATRAAAPLSAPARPGLGPSPQRSLRSR